jgi:hypothetical protein
MAQDPNNFWEQLERLEKLIRASELKAGIIFSFHSLILGIFIDRSAHIQEIFQESAVFIVLACLWLLSVLISIYFCFKCFMPQLEKKYAKNVFFFKDAASAFGTIEEYTNKLMNVCTNQEELFTQLSQQIHIESKIIDKKFDCIKKSLKFFALSFIFIILILVFWLIRL